MLRHAITAGLCFLMASGFAQKASIENTMFKDIVLNTNLGGTELYSIVYESQRKGKGENSALEPGCWICDEVWRCQRKEIANGVEFFKLAEGITSTCGTPFEETIYTSYFGHKVSSVGATTYNGTVYEIVLKLEYRWDISLFEKLKHLYGQVQEMEMNEDEKGFMRWENNGIDVNLSQRVYSYEYGSYYTLTFTYNPLKFKLVPQSTGQD